MTDPHFVLFESEGMVKAMMIPFTPVGFEFEGKTYRQCRQSLIEFNYLTRGLVLVGFEFPSPDDGGEAFLASRFVRDSRNVELVGGSLCTHVLEIHLGPREGAESDQSLALGIATFVTAERDYILALPLMPWARLEIGFELVTDGGPCPKGSPPTQPT